MRSRLGDNAGHTQSAGDTGTGTHKPYPNMPWDTAADGVCIYQP